MQTPFHTTMIPSWILESWTAPIVEHMWLGHVEGLENVPRRGPYVVIANHASYLDFLIIGVLFHRRIRQRIRFWANRKVTSHPFFRFYASAFSAVVVDVESHSGQLWRQSARVLRDGGVVCIFPEGTRSRTGQVGPFRTGYLRLAARCGVHILPLYLDGSFSILPPQNHIPRIRKCDIRIHAPILFPAGLDRAQIARENQRIRTELYGGYDASCSL